MIPQTAPAERPLTSASPLEMKDRGHRTGVLLGKEYEHIGVQPLHPSALDALQIVF